MKDKEKQIEEMARIIGHCYCDKECQNKCAYCDISSRNEAKKLYENGFRKIHEDSIIVSKEDWKENHDLAFMSGKKEGSKETAEKIYWALRKECFSPSRGYYESDGFNAIDWVLKDILAKQFGVEIKE